MELLLLFFLTLLNGLFSMSEMAIVSARKARLQHLADEGKQGARVALQLAQNPSTFLATIQVGITVIGISSGAFGEATLVTGLSEWLSQWPLLDRHSQGMASAIVISGITLASLILGELVPKRLALLNPERVAGIVAPLMHLLARITYPVVHVLTAATEGFLNLLGLRSAVESPVTEEEIKVLMEQGAEAGVFEEHEQQLVNRVFRLDEMRVTGVMTPRGDIVYLDLDDPLAANVQRIRDAHHSRFPVVHGGLKNIEGIVLAKSLLEASLAGRPFELTNLAKPLFVPETLTVMELMASFKKHRQTMALVVNEFGDTVGLATLNDVMEALVGDIATAEDENDRDVVQRDDSSWLIDGSVTVERFKDVLDIDQALPEQELESYQTIGGFAMLMLDRVPRVADRFDWDDLTFEIVDMDGNRVDKLLVTRRPPAVATASA
ncbi:MAG: HlyC/CorC family transporter [Betaproteobacteria bacterium]|jgi:putative hemolysin|nr:HlyC/CorC family transporter [Betaproteobacteria bacterium]MBK7081006.1 HlyC/CorC family transporter [Betaproteobacteria bacterium]MBK7590115.1 HlyC/CorC family transporter [Betaproteobacteria bacterium]MBK7743713.1 HlyC/CorC family transporter [Betaproteobacteria bacterium]MBK8687292.1 HlyC/CorC family transporter [Betaproteobacteria bacterium]